MDKRELLAPIPLSSGKDLCNIVENRRVYTLNHCELNVFETYRVSEQVSLSFNDLVVTNMLRGKKVMHLFNKPGFDYLPGETVLVPPHLRMLIDFPTASEVYPTQCTALAISRDQILNTLDYLNEHHPLEDDRTWALNFDQYHFVNNIALAASISKLLSISTSKEVYKDVLADLSVKELLIRIMQTQHLQVLDQPVQHSSANKISYIVNYIREHLSERITISDLCGKIGMSRPAFFRSFRNELGISPTEFIIKERIRLAKEYLASSKSSIKEACFVSGFNSLHYFNRTFKKYEGITPGSFQSINQVL